MPTPRKERTPCLSCGEEPARPWYKYCSNTCQQGYQRKKYIQDWKNGNVSGLLSTGVVSKYVKDYLRDKFDNKCCFCGWAETNKKTGVVPLVADHVDGNWRNNTEENLRLVCPNCDSLSPTYAALNRGNGRRDRPLSMRVKEARRIKGARQRGVSK